MILLKAGIQVSGALKLWLPLLIFNLIFCILNKVPKMINKKVYYEEMEKLKDKNKFAQKFVDFDIIDLAKHIAAFIDFIYLLFFINRIFYPLSAIKIFGCIFFSIVHIYNVIKVYSIKEYDDIVDYNENFIELILMIVELIFLILFAVAV